MVVWGSVWNTLKSQVRLLASACRYAYGLLLWCLFSGRPHAWADAGGRPPTAAAFTAITHRILTLGDRPDLAALRPDTPPGVTALMRRCWAQARKSVINGQDCRAP